MEIYWFGEFVFVVNVFLLGVFGVVFGFLVGYGMLFLDNCIMLLFLFILFKVKYFVFIYVGVELFMGFGNLNIGVVYYVYLGGVLFGFLFILYWWKFGLRL